MAIKNVWKAEYTNNYMIYERKCDEDFTLIYPCNRPSRSIEAESTPGTVRLDGLGNLKEIHLILTRTRDLPACSVVPQPTTLLCAPILLRGIM
jgi:hypothetical protein